jgi:hypothetical protein
VYIIIKIILLSTLFLLPIFSRASWAQKIRPVIETAQSEGRWWQEIEDGFDYTIKILSFGTSQDLAEGTQNPDNDFLELARYRYDLELRPDLNLNWRRLDLGAKPRVNLEWQQWKSGKRAGDEYWDDDWYLNEWIARVRIGETVFVSYGRENLQWGPSYLISPSNPFFRDNGRRNPIQEVPGMDFGRIVWLPNEWWTLSLIANTGEGRQENSFGDFEETYALKLDYNGQESYASLIVSHRSGDRGRLGSFAGWTATDALLLYAEGAASRGTNALYPEKTDSPLGAAMEAVDDESAAIEGTALVGGSYTLAVGPTLTLEYVYNNSGYSDSEADNYYELRRNAADTLGRPGTMAELGALTLSQTLDPGLNLLRRNYVMLQYIQTDVRDVLDITCRWTQNIDDGSGQFNSILQYYWGDHIQVFSVGTINSGGADTEFGSILDYQWMLGLEYTF